MANENISLDWIRAYGFLLADCNIHRKAARIPSVNNTFILHKATVITKVRATLQLPLSFDVHYVQRVC